MFLFQSDHDSIDAGVAVKSEGAGVVGNGVSVGVDQYRGFGEFAKDVANDGFHGGGEVEGGALF